MLASARLRRAALGAAVLGLALPLASCAQGTGGDTSSSSAADFDPGAKLSGSLTAMGFGATDEIGKVRLDAAKEALGSDVDVKLVEGDLDIQQFLSAVATGKPPDLVYADRGQIGTFASRGAIIPLTDCVDGEGIATDDFDPAALDQVTFEGTVYGIPEFTTVQITQANQQLLSRAGLSLDDINGSSWEALSAANKKLAQVQDGKPQVIGYDSKLPEFLPLWAKANGADLVSEDGRTAQLDDPKVVEALTWAVSIYDAEGGFGAVKAVRDAVDFFGEGNQFARGTLGAMPMENWYVNVLNDVTPDAPMAFDTVRDREGEPLAYGTGSAWAIPSGSKNSGAACRFIKTMTAADTWVKAAQERVRLRKKDGGLFTGLLTANTKADDEIRAMVEPSGERTWDSGVQAIYDANDHVFTEPANPAGQEFETAWQDAVNRVLNGQQDPEAAMKQAQQEGQQALDDAWAQWEKNK